MINVLLVPLTSALVLLAAAATPAAAKEYAGNDVEVAHDCATDPVIDVDGTNITLKATGVCTTVDVTGNDITLTANDVSELSITGSDNKIFVVVTSSITVTGSDNVVKYEKAAGKAKRPKIRKVGSNNLVTKGKST